MLSFRITLHAGHQSREQRDSHLPGPGSSVANNAGKITTAPYQSKERRASASNGVGGTLAPECRSMGEVREMAFWKESGL
jgi:hypothetical protein